MSTQDTTITIDASAAVAHPAYTPTPSIPRLLAELVGEEFFARYAAIRGDAEAFHPDYLADRRRTALLLRAVIADLVALADPADAHHGAQAAAAANAVRRADGERLLPARDARSWLRNQYQDYLEDDSSAHPPNCPGGCRGTGEVIKPIVWQDDGVPLHAEPVGCLRGEADDPHAGDCLRCFGTGRLYDADRGEYSLCYTYTPDPAYKPAPPSSPTFAADEPPF
ncbi:hypothetical protein ACFYY1_37105 [Streptomyces sp. NPDC001890]|uniref:hypothetical protein n=1 Tax=Streptomyces sp. NPDC001890 TaxID=3364620 RepID=UPI00368159AA